MDSLSRNLDDVILKDVQPRCLCIEDDQVCLFTGLQESLQIRLILTQQIGRGKGCHAQPMDKLSGRSGRGTYFQALKHLRPGKRVQFIIQYAQMRNKEFHLRGREKIRTRDFEMRKTDLCKGLTDLVCITVGIDNDCGRSLRGLF